MATSMHMGAMGKGEDVMTSERPIERDMKAFANCRVHELTWMKKAFGANKIKDRIAR
jgi:hypothetical protein